MNAQAKSKATDDEDLSGLTITQLEDGLKILGVQLATADAKDEESILAKIRKAKETMAEKHKDRGESLIKVNTLIVDYGFKLSDLSEPARAALGATEAVAKPSKDGSAEDGQRNMKPKVPFGTIPFADFGFKPTSTQQAGLAYEFRSKWGASEMGKFIQLIRVEVMKNGIGILDKYMDQGFKDWLAEYKESSRPVGKKIYENKREFMAFWNLKEDGSIDPEGKNKLPDGVTMASLVEAKAKAKK